MNLRIPLAAAGAAAMLVLVPAGGATAAPEDIANEISSEIMSPYCPGVTLHDCPSAAAVELREEIARLAAAGWSRERIMDRLVAEYGPSILAVPEGGHGLVARILPLVAVLGGIVAAAAAARRWSGRGAASPPRQPDDTSPEDRRRIAAELDALRGRS